MSGACSEEMEGRGCSVSGGDGEVSSDQLMLKVATSAHLAESGDESEPKQTPFLVTTPPLTRGEEERETSRRTRKDRGRMDMRE